MLSRKNPIFKGVQGIFATMKVTMREFEMQPVPIDEVLGLPMAPLNLYVRLASDRYVLVGKALQPLRSESFNSYQSKGLKHIFVSLEEYRALWPDQDLTSQSFLFRALHHVYEELAGCGLSESRILDGKRFHHHTLRYCFQRTEIVEMLNKLKGLNPAELKHGFMVGQWAVMIARNISGLPMRDLSKLALAGLLHDIGKLKLPDEIGIQKSDLLQGDARVIYFNHANLGKNLLSNFKFLEPEIFSMIEQHHEHLDGTGLPMGLSGQQIHPLSLVLALANDCVDELNLNGKLMSPESLRRLGNIFTSLTSQFGEPAIQALLDLLRAEAKGAVA